jgi:hypothetical protein
MYQDSRYLFRNVRGALHDSTRPRPALPVSHTSLSSRQISPSTLPPGQRQYQRQPYTVNEHERTTTEAENLPVS